MSEPAFGWRLDVSLDETTVATMVNELIAQHNTFILLMRNSLPESMRTELQQPFQDCVLMTETNSNLQRTVYGIHTLLSEILYYQYDSRFNTANTLADNSWTGNWTSIYRASESLLVSEKISWSIHSSRNPYHYVVVDLDCIREIIRTMDIIIDKLIHCF